MPAHKLQGNRDFDLEAKGESHYRKNFETILGPHEANGVSKLVEASMLIDDSNQYDRNAVRVEVQGLTVGHLSRQDAKMYRALIDGMKIPHDVVLIVQANIRGGFLRDDGEKADYGIWLDFPSDESGAAQFKTIAKQEKPKGCLFHLLSFPFVLTDGIIKLIQSLWKTRNGKIVLLVSGVTGTVFCCVISLSMQGT